MTCPAKSIKDVHNITSFYLLICAHKVDILYPLQYFFYSHFPCFFVFISSLSILCLTYCFDCIGLSMADLTADH